MSTVECRGGPSPGTRELEARSGAAIGASTAFLKDHSEWPAKLQAQVDPFLVERGCADWMSAKRVKAGWVV